MPSLSRRITLAVAGITCITCITSLSTFAASTDYTVEKPVKRLALVIANWKYGSGPLPGAEMDQSAMKARLESLNFSVTTVSNFRNQEELTSALNPFLDQIQFGDFVIVYYSGHGLGFSSENYLVPTQLPKKIKEERFFDYFFSAEDIQRKVRDRQAGISLMIFDACRTFSTPELIRADKDSANNKEIDKGFLRPSVQLATNFVIGYASEPGHAASARPGEQSYFTHAITNNIDGGIYELDDLRRAVISDVITSSHGKQTPWFLDSSTAVIRLRDTEQSLDHDKTLWLSVLGSGAPDMVEKYIHAFPTSRFVNAAREWIRDNPQAPIATTYLPPSIVAQAWDAGTPITVRLSGTPHDFKFPKNSVQTAKTYDAALAYFDLSNRRDVRLTSYLNASDTILASTDQAVRARPSEHANVTDTIPAGTNIYFTDVINDPSGHSWVLADDPVTRIKGYIATSGDFSLKKVNLGIPTAQGYARPEEPRNSGLVRAEDVYTLIEQIKLKGDQPSWASLEVGSNECQADDKSRCALQDDLNALRLLHVEALLAAHGYARDKITSLSNIKDVPSNEIRIRLYATGQRP